ncbi:uncharacterized protein [Triticum aestivum]|nr:uncharacterized protein LOC123081011 [Triticum aestivum]
MPFNDIPQGNSILGWEEFVEDVSHSNVRPPVEEHYVDASFRCNQVLLQWDEPHMEVKKRWNFLDQLMPLYSTQSGFYKEDFPSTSLMDKTHKLLASISSDDSVWKIITSVTSRATQTPQRRGVLIRPIEPYDSDDGPPIKKQRTKYQLRFVNTVCNDYFTRENIKSEDGNLLKVALYDENNLVVTSGPLSAAFVEIVLLHGDFNAEGQDYWTSEEFSDCLVHPQSVKEPPALGGDRVLTLTDGEADLGNVYFRTSSFHARTEKFKMGVEIKNVREECVQEGITSPFFVRVRQGEESIGQWITSLKASLRVSKQVPPLECDARKYVDALAVKMSTEEKFKTGKLKVKREKDKNKYEEDLRILMEDHQEFTLKTEDMRKEGRAELNHYILSPPQRSMVIQSTRFRLVIENSVSRTIYKNSTVKTEDGGDHIKVVMYDGGKPIAFDHPLASITVDLVIIEGGFDEKRDSWSKEEFEESIIEPRKGIKRLVKNGTFDLIDGRCDHHGAIIMDNSLRMEVKLGVRIAVHTDIRVIEGVSNPFKMKEVRTRVHGKSTIPYKDDAVHRLKKIALKGKHWNNLEDQYITKVKHLLRHYHKDKFGLQKLVDMKKEDWNTMINHATMCVPGDEIYSYCVQEDNCEILFNDFYDLVGKITDDYVPYSVNDVDQFPQLKVNNWKKSAYKKFDERENSGLFGLTPDYFMNNGRPVRAAPLNNDAGPTVQASTWQYPNDRAAQHGLNRSAVCQYTDAWSPASKNTNQNNVIPPTTTADGNGMLGSLTMGTSSTSDMKKSMMEDVANGLFN